MRFNDKMIQQRKIVDPLNSKSEGCFFFVAREEERAVDVATPRDVEAVVEEAGKRASDERSGPINPVIGPIPAGQRRSEGPGWVHGGAGEVAACQGVGPHDEADEQRRVAGDDSRLRRHHDGVDREDHGEGEHELHEQALERAYP